MTSVKRNDVSSGMVCVPRGSRERERESTHIKTYGILAKAAIFSFFPHVYPSRVPACMCVLVFSVRPSSSARASDRVHLEKERERESETDFFW